MTSVNCCPIAGSQQLIADQHAIGIKATQRAMGKAIARYAPVVGAVGVAAYAFYDTRKVALTAIELFRADIVIMGD